MTPEQIENWRHPDARPVWATRAEWKELCDLALKGLQVEAIIEECARVCEALTDKLYKEGRDADWATRACAVAIRALARENSYQR
jgi:hypothetical protein